MGNLSSDKDFTTQPSSELLRAADFIVHGGIGGVPTETVYGLAGDATNGAAINKIFKAKGRPADNPLIVHISNLDMLDGIVSEFNQDAQKLAEANSKGAQIRKLLRVWKLWR